MGNKRKLLKNMIPIIASIQETLQKPSLTIGEGFSGSGIVSRLLKQYASELWVNDIAGYSLTLNQCYLAHPSNNAREKIAKYIEQANAFASDTSNNNNIPKYIQKHWAPKQQQIQKGERVYFSRENGQRIDRYRYFINQLPTPYQPFLLAPLIVQCSIHNNTNGNFSAFYKKDGIGEYGGKRGIDTKRILKPISLPIPLFSPKSCITKLSQKDTNAWVHTLPKLDLVYYDPPYNQHPYNIYYFLLDIIHEWDIHKDIPNTYRGQPKNWKRSPYNSRRKAAKVFEDLIQNTKASFILISYNSGGIIPVKELQTILERKGDVLKIPIEHKTYNRMKGIANYKRINPNKQIQEFFWLVKSKES